MANYVATARTNYFRVKDEEAFRKRMKGFDAEVVTNGDGLFGVIGTNWDGGMPTSHWAEAEDDQVDDDFMDAIAEHLAPGEVAVLEEVGAEKFRYVNGFAIAINSEGERRTIDLDNIFLLARELGENVTQAMY